ncbi:SIR2 family protein [Mycolicibacterium iranicum]|uniref:SIR2 family protein n=1 Tax=Mycolicibacterium iranicum TaxID=912594 RepID=A0ABT4HR11_MYCIR|nr:SIR2 family protein [Mycolicibacterium iranicum]MCZ0732514.1 SIR2 family protein [Mycolicibacterium iranicum]
MPEDYEQAVIEWAHMYNAYQRIAATPEQLSDQIRELTTVFEREGVIPEWAGVDLLRGWAFYIVRAHRHGGAYDPLFVEYPEMVVILDAIRRHPAASQGDLPPSFGATEARPVEANDSAARSGGHLFIVNGDLTRIACDAILIPTDEKFRIEPYWRGVVTQDALPLNWGSRSLIELPAKFRVDSAENDKIAVWLSNVGQVGNQSGFEAFEAKIREFITNAKSACNTDRPGRLYKWPKPRLALPVVGSKKGGGHQRRGDLLKGLVRTLQALAGEHDVDIVLVTASDKAYAAAQRARTESLRGADLTRYWGFDNDALIDRARSLAETAIQRHLVLFLGSGVSAGAGLPTWAQLLDALAAVAGLGKDARKRLQEKDARDYATLIERRMAERQLKLRDQIAIELTAPCYSLQHGLLASLPSKEAVTTNFDTLFEVAAQTGNRKLAVLPNDPRDSGGRWLLKMHGSVDDPQRIVMTRSDFLDMPRQYGALLGLVQGLLLMRHMMFVGYSLKDEDFQELVYEVRAARGGTAGRGTVLTLFRDELDEELWSHDMEVISMVDNRSGDQPSVEYAARQLELFLDLVGYFSATCSAFFLDETYRELVSDQREESLRQTLQGLIASTADAELGSVGYEVRTFLATLGAPDS